MDRLKALWDFQQADMAYDEYENALKNTETRKKLLQHQKYFQGKQQVLKNIEKESAATEKLVAEIAAQIESIFNQLEEKQQELSELEGYDLEDVFSQDVKEMVKECEKMKASLDKNKKKIVEIRHKLEKSNEDIIQTLKQMSASKKEFDRLKEIYGKEIEAGADEGEKLKKQAEALKKNVDDALAAKYAQIKTKWKNPVAVLNGDRCSGCNMQLPSGVVAKVKAGEIIECDSCGRILFVQQ